MITKRRNVAIIAHVDHGKTTLVDQLFKQSGAFHNPDAIEERLMDSLSLEKERGITIQSKTGACFYNDHRINIIDTPGHADFGGEVERVLAMTDGVLFLVDAAEGPMPQSYFVLKKAVQHNLPIIVVMNKIDKPAARPDWVLDQVFDCLVQLNAPDELLDFTTVYASAKEGFASANPTDRSGNMDIIFDTIIEKIPEPNADLEHPFQFQIASFSYSAFMGQLCIGRIRSGKIAVNDEIIVMTGDTPGEKTRVTKLYQFKANEQEEITTAIAGDIVAIAGVKTARIGDALCDPKKPIGLPGIHIDPPTLAITFMANDSPFSGQEGEFVTPNHVYDRLDRAALCDVALHVEKLPGERGINVSGRGELHLGILIENMRREGYEFQCSKPNVILKEENGQKLEPYEVLTIDVSEDLMGSVIEQLGYRKGTMQSMEQEHGQVRLIYHIPSRGLLGYQAEFMMATKGTGVINYRFHEYGPYVGELRTRKQGVLISKETCETVAYALYHLQPRGTLFVGPGVRVYKGQIIGQHAKDDDLTVNAAKSKKLTNMRSAGADDSLVLTPPKAMQLEDYLSFIDDTELVEFTPKSIRIRKKNLQQIS